MAAQIDLLFSTADALSPARAGSGKGYATPGASDWRWHPTSRRLGLPELSISTWFRAFPARQINDQLKAATVRASAEPAARSRCAKAGFSASGRRRRHSARNQGRTSRDGGRSPRSSGSQQNDVAGNGITPTAQELPLDLPPHSSGLS